MGEFGRRIKEYRKKIGLTQDELAEKVGLSSHYYSALAHLPIKFLRMS